MHRPSPIRNPRSKGIKSKNVLQICLLLAVCFWLIFQVKRSHDKKKEFDNTKISSTTNTLSHDEIVKLGRKDLHPKLEKEIELHEEHEEQEDEEEEEKIEDEKDEGVGGNDDEIDETEQEQEKSEVEVDHEEVEEVIDEESQSQTETENDASVDDHDHEEDDGGKEHTHEGREEQYKADDASSAVTHLNTENGTLDINSSEEISRGESVNNETLHENGPPSSTIFDSPNEPQNITREEFATNQTEKSSNSSYVLEVLKSNELNSTDEGEVEVEVNNETEGNNEGEGNNESEGNNEIEGTEEILDPDEIENETHLEEKEVRMDLDTLPEIETEGGNSEDTVVERR